MTDPFLARTMVEALSQGIHPVTGQAVGHNDSCFDEEVQAALREVLAHCTIESAEQTAFRADEDGTTARKRRAAQNAQRYPRGGEAWSPKEEQQMLSMLRRGKNIHQIANALKRTPRAISERMRNLQCVAPHREKETDAKSE